MNSLVNIDEFRVSKGLARYTGAFTPTTSEFVSDTNTQLLLHLNGLDGATSILDGSVSVHRIFVHLQVALLHILVLQITPTLVLNFVLLVRHLFMAKEVLVR